MSWNIVLWYYVERLQHHCMLKTVCSTLYKAVQRPTVVKTEKNYKSGLLRRSVLHTTGVPHLIEVTHHFIKYRNGQLFSFALVLCSRIALFMTSCWCSFLTIQGSISRIRVLKILVLQWWRRERWSYVRPPPSPQWAFPIISVRPALP